MDQENKTKRELRWMILNFFQKRKREENFFFERGKLIELFHECLGASILFKPRNSRGPADQPANLEVSHIYNKDRARKKQENTGNCTSTWKRLFPMQRGGVLEPSLKGCHVELPWASECVLPSHDRTLAS